MNTDTSNTESMKEAMKKALQRSIQSTPSTISLLERLLGEAEEALRESGYTEAVLEWRQGLQTDYGLRYTVYLSNVSSTFENPMFSIFVDKDLCAFQAEGQIQRGLNADNVIDKARNYLLQPHVVELMTGLLRQFRRNAPTPTPDTPSAA